MAEPKTSDTNALAPTSAQKENERADNERADNKPSPTPPTKSNYDNINNN